ncbi:WG repeat-containing protein (plasmid) [Pedobacter sp. BS3]|uniref:WG repeat-containing protein n=1 Tax=Pedobacter sp. BS3 TaxID=2567937 RepID=UPI0011EF4406|nr:WG repeat-containing protein [Pedobacter sp. BS3]TZF86320.1 WG repeat-containing protein [Pedobacter sp. BS3]
MKKLLFIIIVCASFAQTAQAQYKAYQDKNGKWGYKDSQGKVIVKPIYEAAEDYIDHDNHYGKVKLNGKWGFVGGYYQKYKIVVPLVYEEEKDFSGGRSGWWIRS